jgi:glycosyltransferase involved in cell wall biosynthesis
MMHIGVDATCWHNGRGYGRHARALLTALVNFDMQNRYTLFIDSERDMETLPRRADIRLIRAGAPTALAASSNSHRSFQDMWRMSRALSDRAFDVLLFPTVYSYVPVVSRARKLVMIHDVIAETYPSMTLPTTAARLFWKTKVAIGRLQADAIITVSDYSRQGIVEQFRIAPEKVFVVGEASDSVFRALDNPQLTPRLRSLGINESAQNIVYVGGFSPHKNLEMLVEVFSRLASSQMHSTARLVMVGEYKKEIFHSYFETIKNKAEQLEITDRVVFTGYLKDEELVALLNLSTVLVLPSLIEGFGLPAVEAAACGCPVIATNRSPLPGLLGGGGIFIDPSSPRQLEEALIRVMESENVRRQMRDCGIAAARQLTWEAAARQMIDLMQRVVNQ